MPPVADYYSGHGEEVMRKMAKTYGPGKGKQVFYATNNRKRKSKRGKKRRR